MLHIAKMFCLILVATATSISAEDAVLSAVENFNAAVRLSRRLINSKDYFMMQGLRNLKETASFRLQQLVLQGRLSHHEVFDARIPYMVWDEKLRQLLSKAKTEAVRSFANSKEEVKTYVSMYAEHRISAVQAAKFINENKHQLQAIVDSAISTYATVARKVKEMIGDWNDVALPDDRH